nr:NADH-quinone oxidoreductase subunit C [Bacteroidota bacterium]
MNTPSAETFVPQLQEMFGDKILDSQLHYDILAITIKREALHDIMLHLKNNEGFAFLTSANGMHFPDGEQKFGMVYHLHNLPANLRLRIKCFSNEEQPHFKSLVDIFAAANWMEREAYDFFGFHFAGHPDLRRILNMDSLEGWPLRKEYPLEDPTRMDKDDKMFGR